MRRSDRIAQRLPGDAARQFRHLLVALVLTTAAVTAATSILVSRHLQDDAYRDHVDDLRRTALLVADELEQQGAYQ